MMLWRLPGPTKVAEPRRVDSGAGASDCPEDEEGEASMSGACNRCPFLVPRTAVDHSREKDPHWGDRGSNCGLSLIQKSKLKA